MKVLFFTDLHLDNWSAFSTTVAGGYNSRFMQQLNVLENILAYAENENCTIVFGGDLYNRRLLIPSDVLHKTYELLAAYNKQTIYFVIGNHDIYDWNSENNSLAVLGEMDHVRIIDQATSVHTDHGVHLSLVPHGALLPTSSASLRKAIPDFYEVLVTHYGVNEARLGPKDFKMKDDLTVKQLRELNYDLVLLGHIHKPQTLDKNIIVMGSVMGHSFHETDEEKYFYVLDTETKVFMQYPSSAPQFLTIDVKSKTQLNKLVLDDRNYYRLNILTTKITPVDTAKLASRNVIISYTKASGLYAEVDVVKRKVRTIVDEIDEYYDIVETELNRDELKQKALEVVNARS
jgi:DNA repair exonuclease SbcCD nuclease subunit